MYCALAGVYTGNSRYHKSATYLRQVVHFNRLHILTEFNLITTVLCTLISSRNQKSHFSVLHFFSIVLVKFKSENHIYFVVYIEFKTVDSVIEIHTHFSNRGSHTNVDGNESSSSESEKEN